MENITGQDISQDLARLAARVCENHAAVNRALSDALDRAMDAGDALIAAKTKVGHGRWTSWLRHCDLIERTARVYMQLAAGRAVLDAKRQRAAVLTLRQALTLLKADPARQKKRAAPSALSALAWINASPEARTRFLSTIGLISILRALPPQFRAELDRRGKGQRAAAASPLGDKITKALRAALSHAALKTEHDRASALASLNGIRNLLAGHGLDLHDLEAAAKPKKAEAA